MIYDRLDIQDRKTTPASISAFFPPLWVGFSSP